MLKVRVTGTSRLLLTVCDPLSLSYRSLGKERAFSASVCTFELSSRVEEQSPSPASRTVWLRLELARLTPQESRFFMHDSSSPITSTTVSINSSLVTVFTTRDYHNESVRQIAATLVKLNSPITRPASHMSRANVTRNGVALIAR